MENFKIYLKEFRILLFLFPLMRLFFRNLWTLYMFIFAKRTLVCGLGMMKRNSLLRERFLNDKYVLEFFPHYKDSVKKNEEEIPPDDIIDSLKNKLSQLMETKQMYKHCNLTVDDVSRELAINRTYLSQVIKYSFQTGFRDFINKSRLEKAQELMSGVNSENSNLLSISEQVGFQNYGTFNAAFKKEYGMTPGEWKRREAKPVK